MNTYRLCLLGLAIIGLTNLVNAESKITRIKNNYQDWHVTLGVFPETTTDITPVIGLMQMDLRGELMSDITLKEPFKIDDGTLLIKVGNRDPEELPVLQGNVVLVIDENGHVKPDPAEKHQESTNTVTVPAERITPTVKDDPTSPHRNIFITKIINKSPETKWVAIAPFELSMLGSSATVGYRFDVSALEKPLPKPILVASDPINTSLELFTNKSNYFLNPDGMKQLPEKLVVLIEEDNSIGVIPAEEDDSSV